MNPQPQGHVMDNPYHQEDIKPDSILVNKARSPSQYQDGDNVSYSKKEALKQIPVASSWPKFSGTGEYDHMELIDYIDGLFIDVPSTSDYWITDRLNTELKGHASCWYKEMNDIDGRRNWPWWKNELIQKNSNGTWIWKKTMPFENDKYSVDKDPYGWCLRQSKRLKAIDPQMNIEVRNHKLLTQMLGELEHAVKCRCNQNFTLDDIANTLLDIRKSTNIGKYSTYKSSGSREKKPFRVEFKDKPRDRCQKAKKKGYAIEKVPEEESPTEDSESEFMGDAIREQYDEDQDPREGFLVEYQEETPLEIQDIQLEADMPQDNENKNLCQHTKEHKNSYGQKLSGSSLPKLGKAALVNQGKELQKCIREDGIHWDNYQRDNYTHRKGNIRLNPEFCVLEDAHIQGFLLGTDYQRMYGIDIYNSKNRHITIGTNKEKKFSLDIYQISTHDPLEELLNEFREGQFSTTLTSKQKITLLKMLRKNRPEFAIGEEPLGKIRGHDIELYLDVERPYPPMLRIPPYQASLETRKEIEKHINELLEMDFIRKIGHNEIVELTTPGLITWHDGNSMLCGDFRALNNCTKADTYPIPRIPHSLDKLAKSKYITKMNCMKGFHQNGVEPSSMRLLIIIFHMGIYEYTRMPFGIKNESAHFQRMMDTIFQEEILEGWMVVYIDDIIIYSETWEDHVHYIERVLTLGHKVSGLSMAIDQNKGAEVLLKPVPKNIKGMQSFLGIKHELTNAPVLILPDFELPFKLEIDAEFSQGLGAALHQRQLVDGEPREGVICYIPRQLKDSEARYGATLTECLCLVCALEKLYHYLEHAVFEVYTDFTALKSLLNMNTANRHMLRSQIAIQEYRGNMTII
ncbi:hypothetical protein O181_039518 [Austropuccinia psidii MF-1]|uniref:Reverse transcriptase domain-containing protein n=1 Tax=Austropuccinia psidii MF-1 TaxID=1389203 RepID=A0A9Q3DDJ5_9BASI|nr:hypothetical protein [Austropuccinia psidii MF-1]